MQWDSLPWGRQQQDDLGEDHVISDRRLSYLLPVEMVRQIGFDPNCFLFPQSLPVQRRMTDPILVTVTDDAAPPQRRATVVAQPQSANQALFRVELWNSSIAAFSALPIVPGGADGVVVNDGRYLRFGRAVERLKTTQTDAPVAQIVAVDKNCQLGEYMSMQAEIARAVMPSFMMRAECETRFLDLETVSYQARALFRVKVENADARNIDRVVRLLIQMFAIAVEVYD